MFFRAFVLLTNFMITAAAAMGHYHEADTIPREEQLQVDTLAPAGQYRSGQADTLAPEPQYYRLNARYLKSFWPSLTYTVSRPANWEKKDWVRFSVATASIGALMAADWEIRHIVQHNRGGIGEKIANTAEPFGNTYGVYIFPAMYVAGLITKQPKFESAGLTGVKALAISTVIYTASKKLIRRARPDATNSAFDYALPFAKQGYTSSPSGHSNTIFTVATALALEFRDTKWVPPLVYTIAGVTAISRIYHNRHWASDVVMGSLLGHFVTKAVWQSSQKKKAEYRTF